MDRFNLNCSVFLGLVDRCHIENFYDHFSVNSVNCFYYLQWFQMSVLLVETFQAPPVDNDFTTNTKNTLTNSR